VRVNAVCPGIIDSPLVQSAGKESGKLLKQMVAATPAGRLGEPEEIASPVVWLRSDGASFAMGHPFTLDGGLTVQWAGGRERLRERAQSTTDGDSIPVFSYGRDGRSENVALRYV
jgi:enoyl-[acyl-carrier-protein] reductase (NADH)